MKVIKFLSLVILASVAFLLLVAEPSENCADFYSTLVITKAAALVMFAVVYVLVKFWETDFK